MNDLYELISSRIEDVKFENVFYPTGSDIHCTIAEERIGILGWFLLDNEYLSFFEKRKFGKLLRKRYRKMRKETKRKAQEEFTTNLKMKLL